LNSIMARVIEQAQNPHGEFGSELQKTWQDTEATQCEMQLAVVKTKLDMEVAGMKKPVPLWWSWRCLLDSCLGQCFTDSSWPWWITMAGKSGKSHASSRHSAGASCNILHSVPAWVTYENVTRVLKGHNRDHSWQKLTSHN
jgi:hypothetical protein